MKKSVPKFGSSETQRTFNEKISPSASTAGITKGGSYENLTKDSKTGINGSMAQTHATA